MRQLSTGHPDVILIEPQFFRDDRGYFCETYNQQSFAKIGISDKFVQDNESASSYGVVRGLHFQRGIHAQAKLIRVLCGDILDVAVDIRMGSPMFGQVVCCQLSAENHRQYISLKVLHMDFRFFLNAQSCHINAVLFMFQNRKAVSLQMILNWVLIGISPQSNTSVRIKI